MTAPYDAGPALSGLRVLAAAAHRARPLGRPGLATPSGVVVGRDASAERIAAVAASRMEAEGDAVRAARLAAPELAALAVDIARALVGEAVSRDPAVMTTAVSDVLARFAHARRALVRVHPEDVAAARTAVGRWADRAEVEAAEVVADPTVARGDVRVETDRGRLDAILATRLAALQAALQGDAEAT